MDQRAIGFPSQGAVTHSFLQTNYSTNMDYNFRILPVRDFLPFINNEALKRDPVTQAKMYEGTNGKYYLIPAVGGRGIESNDKQALDSILESGHIPIEEDWPNMFVDNKMAVQNISDSARHVIAEYCKKFGLSIDIEDRSFDFGQLDSLINKTKKEERLSKFAFFVGLVIGEKIRFERHAVWKLEKRYGYNPFFEPKLFEPESKSTYNPWYWIVRSLDSGRKFHFASEYERVMKINGKL